MRGLRHEIIALTGSSIRNRKTAEEISPLLASWYLECPPAQRDHFQRLIHYTRHNEAATFHIIDKPVSSYNISRAPALYTFAKIQDIWGLRSIHDIIQIVESWQGHAR